jgi:hypothetical protein
MWTGHTCFSSLPAYLRDILTQHSAWHRAFPNPPIKLGTLPLQNGTFTYQLPPFSVTTFVLRTQSGAAATTPPSLTTIATPNPTHTPNDTSFSTTVFLHGIGKGGDNVKPNGGGNNTPLHGFAVVREQKKDDLWPHYFVKVLQRANRTCEGNPLKRACSISTPSWFTKLAVAINKRLASFFSTKVTVQVIVSPM